MNPAIKCQARLKLGTSVARLVSNGAFVQAELARVRTAFVDVFQWPREISRVSWHLSSLHLVVAARGRYSYAASPLSSRAAVCATDADQFGCGLDYLDPQVLELWTHGLACPLATTFRGGLSGSIDKGPFSMHRS